MWLPYLVIIIDEIADVAGHGYNDAEGALPRLAQTGRAAGVHLVVVTQRPSVDVIVGIIKAGFPSRLAFRFSSGVDSWIAVDCSGGDGFASPAQSVTPVVTDCVFCYGNARRRRARRPGNLPELTCPPSFLRAT